VLLLRSTLTFYSDVLQK